jgi:hypothetical protein
MKNSIYVFITFLCVNIPIQAQKSALDFLNNAPKPPVNTCACTESIYAEYELKMESYCDKIQAEIEDRENKATKNDLSGDAAIEYKHLLEKIINKTQIPALKFYCLDVVCDEYPELLNESERKRVNDNLQTMESITLKRANIVLHKSTEKENAEWVKETAKAQEEYCSIMSDKYKAVLEEEYSIIISLIPDYKRMGELEYSGSSEAFEIPLLNAVQAYLSQYALRYYCGNLKIK